MTRIIGNILIILNSEYKIRHIAKQTTRHKTMDRIRTRLRQKMYTAVAEVEPPALEPSLAMSSRKRVLMSGKTSLSVRESVTKPVVALIGLPKNLIALLPYRTRSSGVSEAYCPGSRCTPQDGMGKMEVAQCSGTEGARDVWQSPRGGATSLSYRRSREGRQCRR